jgi:hypothetical protein
MRTPDGQIGSNANVAGGGICKGTRSAEIRPIMRSWPLAPLRPKRAASDVAGLRYGSGQRKTNHALTNQSGLELLVMRFQAEACALLALTAWSGKNSK